MEKLPGYGVTQQLIMEHLMRVLTRLSFLLDL
jgi:hypothetical protein